MREALKVLALLLMILLSLAAAFVAVGTREAQSTPSVAVAEPQYMNSFYALDANGKLIELERQTVTFRTKAKVFPGYASVKMTTEFKPGHSPVRITATEIGRASCRERV